MTYEPPKFYSLFEKRETPQHDGGWAKWEDFGYRASWRLFNNTDPARMPVSRDYRSCVEYDVGPLLAQLREQLGPQNERWAYDHEYVYFYFKTLNDVTEFRLTIELPNDPLR